MKLIHDKTLFPRVGKYIKESFKCGSKIFFSSLLYSYSRFKKKSLVAHDRDTKIALLALLHAIFILIF